MTIEFTHQEISNILEKRLVAEQSKFMVVATNFSTCPTTNHGELFSAAEKVKKVYQDRQEHAGNARSVPLS